MPVGQSRDDRVSQASDRSRMLLNRAELLLAAAERVQVETAEQNPAWHDALKKMLRSSETLRTEVLSNSAALVEEARRERDCIAAEVEMLRAERDLCLALAVEAGSAAGRHLVMLRQSQAPNGHEDETAGGEASVTGHSVNGAQIDPAAARAVASIELRISGLHQLQRLLEIEAALSKVPNVGRLQTWSLADSVAAITLQMLPPTPPVVVAMDIDRVAGNLLKVIGVDSAAISLENVELQP